MMSRAKDPKKEIRGRDKELKSYKDTLRDASLQYEDKVLELSLLRRVGDIVGYIIDPELFYRMFVDILLEETNAENCSIMLMNTETDRLDLKMARGRNDEGKFFNHPVDSEVTFFLGEEVEKKVALERKTILIDDVSIDKCFAIKETHFPIGSLLCTPLIFQEKIFGVINLSHTQPHAFSQSNQRTMDLLCTLVSSIIGNAIDYIKVKDQGKFKSMFEGVRIPILLVDPKTNSIVGCNGYAEEWLGYSKKELIHTDHIFDIVPYEYREKVECILNEIVEKNSSKFNEVSFIRKDGSVNIGEINGAMIDYQGKNIVQLTVKDVTERNQVENKLKETNEYLDNLIESSLDPIVTTDNKGNVTRTNKAFLKLLSHRKEEVIGKHMAEFSPIEEGTYRSTTDELVEINKEFFDNIKTFISDLVEEGKIFNWDSYLIRNDKKLIPVEENIVFFCNEKGDRTGAVGIIRDITERRKAESETKEAKEFMENIFKTSVDGIMVTNNKGSITLVNEAITKMLGYSKNELIGKRTGVFNPKGESYKKNVGKYLTLLFEEGTINAFELTYLKEDRNLIDVEVNSALLRDNKGNITGTVSTIRDITERKQDEAQLKETKDHLDNIIESSLDGIIVSDSVGNVIRVNKSFLALVGFEEEEVIG
ncbi:MAG: PAS domain S-box protein, partial [Thermodesulfobacteriota bacterium]